MVALRLNSDVIRWEDRGDRIVKDKIPKAPGGKWVGLVLLFSAETGEPLAIFPDGVIQAFRVAASSALAAKYMARTDVTHLGIFGSGWQARAHVEAFCKVRSFEKVLVFSPTKPTGSRSPKRWRRGWRLRWSRARRRLRWRSGARCWWPPPTPSPG